MSDIGEREDRTEFEEIYDRLKEKEKWFISNLIETLRKADL